jgi:hypothetical protein
VEVQKKAFAHLWDGNKKLGGELILTPKDLFFEFHDFRNSHLSMRIPLFQITECSTFILFDISRKGLRVATKDKRENLFVLEDPVGFRDLLMQNLK